MHARTLGVSLAIALSSSVFAQTTDLSSYIFRYNAGVSQVLMTSVTFPQQAPLQLSTCQATEMINGAIHCAINCQGVPVCLLLFVGPPGLTSNDVLEKFDESPVSSSGASIKAPASAFTTQ